MPCDGSRHRSTPLDKKQNLSAFLEYASFRNRFLLVHLSQASAANTGLGGQKLRVAEGKSSSPLAPSEENRKVLECANRASLPGNRHRSRRRSQMALDRLPCRL